MSSIFDRARGRWEEILTSPGVGIDEKILNGKHHPCPAGRKSTDTFRYKRDADGGYFCCGTRANGLDLIMHAKGCSYREACEMAEDVVGKADSYKPRERTWSETLLEKAKPLKARKSLPRRPLPKSPPRRKKKRLNNRQSGHNR